MALNELALLGTRHNWSTNQEPIEAYLSHLRHLSKPVVAAGMLRDRFAFTGSEARNVGRLIAAYVSRGIDFYRAAQAGPESVRPVAQYYAYLNLAVAVILAYRPHNYAAHRTHGLSDLTHAIEALDLSSRLVKTSTRDGAITLFHRIISGEAIDDTTFRLLELLVPVGHVAVELEFAYRKQSYMLTVCILDTTPSTADVSLELTFGVSMHSVLAGSRLSRPQIERAMPQLRTAFKCQACEPRQLVYVSKTKHQRAGTPVVEWRKRLLPFLNLGVDFSDNVNRIAGRLCHWHVATRQRILPALSAALMLSFSLASIARYRPTLLQAARGSRVNILLESFAQEVDSLVIPAMRNLLYNEDATFTRIPTV